MILLLDPDDAPSHRESLRLPGRTTHARVGASKRPRSMRISDLGRAIRVAVRQGGVLTTGRLFHSSCGWPAPERGAFGAHTDDRDRGRDARGDAPRSMPRTRYSFAATHVVVVPLCLSSDFTVSVFPSAETVR